MRPHKTSEGLKNVTAWPLWGLSGYMTHLGPTRHERKSAQGHFSDERGKMRGQLMLFPLPVFPFGHESVWILSLRVLLSPRHHPILPHLQGPEWSQCGGLASLQKCSNISDFSMIRRCRILGPKVSWILFPIVSFGVCKADLKMCI